MLKKLVQFTAVAAICAASIPALCASLSDSAKTDIAMKIVAAAENNTLNWQAQYSYIEDIGDDRGYTGGIIGFCSGCYDMYEVVAKYVQLKPRNNVLAKYVSTLKRLGETESSSTTGLGSAFERDWRTAARDNQFKQAQNFIRDRDYRTPAINFARTDGLSVLGQFIYFDSIIMHGLGDGMADGFETQRRNAMRQAPTPAQGGDEKAYLEAFLDARIAAMQQEEAHQDTSRVTGAQAVFLEEENWDLTPPLRFTIYRDDWEILR